jgi:hypothetical protein
MSNAKRARRGPQRRSKPNSVMVHGKPVALPQTINRYNAYICDKCNQGFRSRDVNAGVTPMFSQCFATEGCPGRARSLIYQVVGTPAEEWPVRIEWYAPVAAAIPFLSHEMQEHVSKDGLVRRAAPEAPEWVKERA